MAAISTILRDFIGVNKFFKKKVDEYDLKEKKKSIKKRILKILQKLSVLWVFKVLTMWSRMSGFA